MFKTAVVTVLAIALCGCASIGQNWKDSADSINSAIAAREAQKMQIARDLGVTNWENMPMPGDPNCSMQWVTFVNSRGVTQMTPVQTCHR